MELAIPILALGGMYIISNKGKETPKPNDSGVIEGFKNKVVNTNITAPHTENYPLVRAANDFEDLNNYENANAATDRYFQQDVYQQEANADPNKFYSLTGEQVSLDNFTHNNMQPYFGSTVKQRTFDLNSNESILDSKQGTGSQSFQKEARAPLFAPSAHMSWTNGAPNSSDFIQSRVIPGRNMNNVKPWQEIRVAPGMDDGYTAAGSGGFNAGMSAREQWAPKTVDELRTTNNPKLTYDGVITGVKHYTTNRGIEGAVEKNRPDTFFINSPDRYLTTTGLEKKQMARGIQMLGNTNRVDTTTEYYGALGGDGRNSSYVPGAYHASTRPELAPYSEHVSNAYAPGKTGATNGDYGIQGYDLLPNARSLTTERSPNLGSVGRIMSAIVLPLQDMLRPSRKENVVGNHRVSGNAATTVPNSYVLNPADRPKTTTKETTIDNPYPANIGNTHLQGYGYLANEHQPTNTHRADTSHTNYSGAAGSGVAYAAPVYDSAYNAYLNTNKEAIAQSRTSVGNHKMFDPYMNIQIDKLDSDRNTPRMFVPQQLHKVPVGSDIYGKTTNRSEARSTLNLERNTPDMLSALNSNPYARQIGTIA
uniref:Uncharacterized protein n=1 Tax=viral metagenome TaxID=1070528 RepID=A0A6C0BW83_9ZZZZ